MFQNNFTSSSKRNKIQNSFHKIYISNYIEIINKQSGQWSLVRYWLDRLVEFSSFRKPQHTDAIFISYLDREHLPRNSKVVCCTRVAKNPRLRVIWIHAWYVITTDGFLFSRMQYNYYILGRNFTPSLSQLKIPEVGNTAKPKSNACDYSHRKVNSSVFLLVQRFDFARFPFVDCSLMSRGPVRAYCSAVFLKSYKIRK